MKLHHDVRTKQSTRQTTLYILQLLGEMGLDNKMDFLADLLVHEDGHVYLHELQMTFICPFISVTRERERKRERETCPALGPPVVVPCQGRASHQSLQDQKKATRWGPGGGCGG